MKVSLNSDAKENKNNPFFISAVPHPNVKPMAYANSLLSLFGQRPGLGWPREFQASAFVRVSKYFSASMISTKQYRCHQSDPTGQAIKNHLKTENENSTMFDLHEINHKHDKSIFKSSRTMKLYLVIMKVMSPQIRTVINMEIISPREILDNYCQFQRLHD